MDMAFSASSMNNILRMTKNTVRHMSVRVCVCVRHFFYLLAVDESVLLLFAFIVCLF
jgi:hypothetical protein